MMRKKNKIYAFITALWILSPAIRPTTAQSSDEGTRTFSSICASCHGLDGKGAERGPDIAKRRAVQQLSDAALFRVIHDGKAGTGMPPFNSLGDARIHAVVRHLRQLQGEGATAALPGDPRAGRELFFGKASCSQCHAARGDGGFIASDLSSVAVTKGAAEIRAAIVDPNKNLDPRSRTVVVSTADGQTLTGIARNEDNFSLQLQTMDGAFHLLDKSQLQRLDHQPQSLMPADYGSKLTSKELDALVGYLMSISQQRLTPKIEEEE